MKIKRAPLLMRTIIIGTIALAGVASAGAQQASRSGVNPPTAAAMEQHWQSLIHERDPARRQVLITEHRGMMEEAQKADKGRIPARGTKTSAMMQDSGHHDLRNTIEMHSIMLDMMK